ncbi:hypothetical protein SDC9_08018 [bioreactor metagenome]|uniref:Peptidoglycan binding-like domain-containing protein n=1 Tax=bioreactor metagenome TaxID=1076179 RepID=A0A644T650_9ZZZZ|nr:peptidoglycan-binding protein [Candidatus Elulimicrobiales bacterium]
MKKALLTIFVLILSIFSFNVSSAQTTYGCYTFKYYLIRGSTDASTQGEVSRLQGILYNAGFLETEPTGYFGVLTENAVRKYQYSKNIQATGTVGPVTRTSLSNCSNQNTQTGTGGALTVDFHSFNKKTTLPVPYGSILVLPNLTQDSSFPGYVFDGWYVNSNFATKYNSSIIASSQALYAKWVKSCNQSSMVVYPNDCPSSSSNTTTTTTTTTTTGTIPYQPMSDEMKECSYGSYTLTIPVEITCP